MTQFRQDKMTENERWDALVNRQPIDRVPLFLASLGFSLRNVGQSVMKAYQDPEMSFWGQVWTNEMYGAMHCTRYIGGAFGVREFGGEVRMPKGEYAMAPSLLRPPIESEEDIERLELHEIQISDYEKLPEIFNNFAEMIEEIGMNPFKGM